MFEVITNTFIYDMYGSSIHNQGHLSYDIFVHNVIMYNKVKKNILFYRNLVITGSTRFLWPVT